MSTPICIIPAKFVQSNSRAARVWALVRSWNHPDNYGSGCGVEYCTIEEIAKGLGRSVRTAYRYIKAALQAGFIYECKVVGDALRIRYASLTKIAMRLDLDRLGAIAEFPLEEVHLAKVKAAEATAFYLQRASFWQMKRQYKSRAKSEKHADQLLSCRASERMTGSPIIRRGKRVLYLRKDWKPFGVTQAGIARHLGCSERTVQRRLSDSWREVMFLPPVNKVQAAILYAENLSKEERRLFLKHAPENIRHRLIAWGRNIFFVCTNLYDPPTRSRNQRFRKAKYRATPTDKANKCAENRSPGGVSPLDYLINSRKEEIFKNGNRSSSEGDRSSL